MHAIPPHIEFEHIKGKENVLADSLPRQRCLGLHDDNDPEHPGQEYSKSIFDTDKNIINSLDNDQNSNDKFKINEQKYILDKNDTDNTHASSTSTNSLPQPWSLDLQKIRQLQQQDEYITKLIAKCKSSKNNEIRYYLDEQSITERSEMDLISFMPLWFLIPCNLIFCLSAIMHRDMMVPPDCTILLEETITGKSYITLVINMCIPAQNVNR